MGLKADIFINEIETIADEVLMDIEQACNEANGTLAFHTPLEVEVKDGQEMEKVAALGVAKDKKGYCLMINKNTKSKDYWAFLPLQLLDVYNRIDILKAIEDA